MEKNFQRDFFDSFSKKIGIPVQSIEMVNIQASAYIFKLLNLTPQPGSNVLWGLLVFCEDKLFFYVHPSESAMGALFRAASNSEMPTEQLLDFSSLDNFRVIEKSAKWYNFFLSDTKFKIDVSFNKDGVEQIFCFNTQKKATEILEKLKKYSSK